MRKVTSEQASQEVTILDLLGNALRERLRENYESLRRPLTQDAFTDDIEEKATLRNIRVSLNEAFEEVARRGYARVAFLQEEDEKGAALKREIFRLSQANANVPEAPIKIVARNSRLGTEIASCRVGDDFDLKVPAGERHFVVEALIDLEGMTPLLRPKPEVHLARFYLAEDPSTDTIRNLRAFVEALSAPDLAESSIPREIDADDRASGLQSTSDLQPTLETLIAESSWPSDWTNVILGNDEDAALGAQFFTHTTRRQEQAIRAVRGVTIVHGIAGTGKTSVALGRLKFFANFRSGEHLGEYGLNPNDWTDFDAPDMVGFVLSPSLVQYLKRTADDLELTGMKILDFDEFRDQERQARRLFGRLYKRSPERNSLIQQSLKWLLAIDVVASAQIADSMESVLAEALAKPDTPDGNAIGDRRWLELETQLWKAGPLRARVVGLIRRLRGRDESGAGSFKLQGIARSVDVDVRLSDRETASLSLGERRAVREAILNIALRFFRLLNPTEMFIAASGNHLLDQVLEESLRDSSAISLAQQAAQRLEKRLITDDDIVAALCLNAVTCEGFERDIADIPYIRSFADKIAVFIDEYQDFSEQQMLLMSSRAKIKYRQVTVAGDASQRLHRVGISNVSDVFPRMIDIREITLTENFRQTKVLARFSRRIRSFTEERTLVDDGGSCRIPLHIFDNRQEFADVAASMIADLPETATVAVITSTRADAQMWFDVTAGALQSAFRHPIVSDRARLTERFRTHFTTPLDVKGLEFDAAIIPDISAYDGDDRIAVNGLYVAVSRPRHGLLVGCSTVGLQSRVVKDLVESHDLVPQR